MYKFFLAVIAITCFTGCGGPCSYEDTLFKATIVSIRLDSTRPVYNNIDTSQRNNVYAVEMTTDIRDRKTLYLDNMIGQSITKEFLDQHNLTEGKTLEGNAHLITSGSCSPGRYIFSDSTLNER